ncbi:DUF4124 domain-containing protein [Thiohalorhabdus sp. Cl-TMA]|uniref:DUF4124 domain-containing protein n=1 Tax=Thiohalorhabdus methylotrophus TaxID=3242694 RepID=A0ABV4TSU9_9GAMM
MPLSASTRRPYGNTVPGTALLLLALAAWIPAPAAAEVIYKWTDDDGTVHYADSPPPGREDVQRIEMKSGAPSTDPSGRKQSDTPKDEPPDASDVNITQAEIQVQKLEKRVEQARKVYEQARQNRIEGEKVRLGSEQNYVRYLERIEKLKEQEKQAKEKLESLRQKLEQARSRLEKAREKAREQ